MNLCFICNKKTTIMAGFAIWETKNVSYFNDEISQ